MNEEEQAAAAAIDEPEVSVDDSAIRASIEYFASFQDVDVMCHYCMTKFDHTRRLPMSLHCGHSVCELCLKEVVENKECPQCIYRDSENVTVRPSPGKSYPYNILLLEVLKYEAASLANQQIKFENLCSSVSNRFLKKFNDVVNSLNCWHDHLQIGEGYLTTLQFYEQELEEAKNLEDSLAGKKIAAQVYIEMDRLAKRFSYEWTQIVNCHKAQNIKGYKLFLFPYYMPTFMTIMGNNPKACYAVRTIRGQEKYYPLTGGENRFHLHCQSPISASDSRPFYFQFSDLIGLVSNKTKSQVFFTMQLTSKTQATSSRYHKIYIDLIYNNHFGPSTLSLFLGDFGQLSYKDFGLSIMPGAIYISCNTPYFQSLEVPDEIQSINLPRSDCTARKVVAEWKGAVGAMYILLDDTLFGDNEANLNSISKRRMPPNIYYGEVISGFDFLRHLSREDEVKIVDCGLSAVHK